jgi:N-acylneuraminate cytidylyltransferase
MKDIKDICFVIQARRQSTRVPDKMLRPFAGSNLFTIALDKVLSSNLIPKENFYACIMDAEFESIAQQKGVNVFRRSAASVVEPLTLQKALEWHDKLNYKYFVLVNACNPLLKVETIDSFVKKFMQTDSRGLFAVTEKKTFFFDKEGKMISGFNGPDKYKATLETKMVEPLYEAAHSLYAGTMEDIKDDVYMGTFTKPGDPDLFTMEEIEAFDIDWPWQFEIAEKMYQS